MRAGDGIEYGLCIAPRRQVFESVPDMVKNFFGTTVISRSLHEI
jgi:hypothetical protein